MSQVNAPLEDLRLRHQELLEAAHIVADRDPEGEPKVRNGLALCKLHHAAFDCHIIGVNPDYRVEDRRIRSSSRADVRAGPWPSV